MLTDSHAHLFMEDWFPDLRDIAEQCKEKGVRYVVNSGLEKDTNQKVLEISETHKTFLPSIGLYPGEVQKKSEAQLNSEIAFLNENISRCSAIGEMGLDGTYPELEKQKKWFSRALSISASHGRPAIIHSRKAEKELIECIESTLLENNPAFRKVILHCFMGSMKLVNKAVEKGWYFTIPAIAGRSEHFKSLIKNVPLRQLLTETDSPFLAPKKGETNYPWNTKEAILEIANVKRITQEETQNLIYLNFARLFLA